MKRGKFLPDDARDALAWVALTEYRARLWGAHAHAYAAIAEDLDVSEVTARNLVDRGKTLFEKLLNQRARHAADKAQEADDPFLRDVWQRIERLNKRLETASRCKGQRPEKPS